MEDVSITGSVTFNGSTGAPVQGGGSLTIGSLTQSVVIGGAVQAHFGNENCGLLLFSQGGDLTINGAVSVTAGSHPADKLDFGLIGGGGHTAHLKGGINVSSMEPDNSVLLNSNGAGSKLIVDVGATFNLTGSVTLTGAKQGTITVNGGCTFLGGAGNNYLAVNDAVHITGATYFSAQSGIDEFDVNGDHLLNGTMVPELDGMVTFAGDGGTKSVNLLSDDPLAPLKFGSSALFQFGTGTSNNFTALNVDFLGGLTIIQGGANPKLLHPNSVDLDGVLVLGAFNYSSQGNAAVVGLAGQNHASPRESWFYGPITITAKGANSIVKASNGNTGTPLHLKSSLTIFGGFPKLQLINQGDVEFNPALVSLSSVLGSL